MSLSRNKEINVSRHRRSHFQKKSGLILLLTGVLCFLIAFSFKEYQESQANSLSFSQPPELVETVSAEEMPVRILIPKMGINLSITKARVIDNHWQVADEGVSYLLGSGIPGKEGNVVIYGHNQNHLFGPIRWLKVNDEIEIINQKEEKFLYEIREIKTVSPETVEVLAPTNDATLTLYTCTGFLDRERFIVVAKLKTE